MRQTPTPTSFIDTEKAISRAHQMRSEALRDYALRILRRHSAASR